MEDKDRSAAIAITGAHSLIGQMLVRHLAADRRPILGLVTPWTDTGVLARPHDRVEYIASDLRLGLPITPREQVKACGTVLHLAWARPADPRRAAAENTAILDTLLDAMDSGARLIFLSSVSATSDSPSFYGKSKFAVAERLRSRPNTVEIIAGLMRSDPPMGPYKVLHDTVLKLPLRPVFLPAPTAFLASEDILFAAIDQALAQPTPTGPVAAFDPATSDLNTVLRDIVRTAGRNPPPVPVPTPLINTLLGLAQGIRPGLAILDRLRTLLGVSKTGVAARLQGGG